MSAKDVKSLFQGFGANLDKDDGLAANVCIDFIASFESFTRGNSVRKFDVTCCLGKLNGTCGALTLSFVLEIKFL